MAQERPKPSHKIGSRPKQRGYSFVAGWLQKQNHHHLPRFDRGNCSQFPSRRSISGKTESISFCDLPFHVSTIDLLFPLLSNLRVSGVSNLRVLLSNPIMPFLVMDFPLFSFHPHPLLIKFIGWCFSGVDSSVLCFLFDTTGHVIDKSNASTVSWVVVSVCGLTETETKMERL